MAQESPLHNIHFKLGAKFTEFGGWRLPLYYISIIKEHIAVRNKGGIFDISHMGKIIVKGPGAIRFVDYCVTNNVNQLPVGKACYSLLCDYKGYTIDDLYIYRIKNTEFLLIVNAARTKEDLEWLNSQIETAPVEDGFEILDYTHKWAALAIQGPQVREWLGNIIREGSISGKVVESIKQLKKNEWAVFLYEGNPIGIACTGYTGEDGFEIVGEAEPLKSLYLKLLELYKANGLQPAGLGARDTLRLEMGYPLYGHELNPSTSPLEAGLERFVKFEKDSFIGKEPLLKQKQQGISKKLIGVVLLEQSPPPRSGCEIYDLAKNIIGNLTSGTISPSLNVGIGLAYVDAASAIAEKKVLIKIRESYYQAKLIPPPFYRRSNPMVIP